MTIRTNLIETNLHGIMNKLNLFQYYYLGGEIMKKRKTIFSLVALILIISIILPLNAFAQEDDEVYTRNLGVNFSYKPLVPYDSKYKDIPGVVIKVINNDTGKEYMYQTDGTEEGVHQLVPAGNYTMKLVAVPPAIEGKFDRPDDIKFTIKQGFGAAFQGFNVVEKPLSQLTDPFKNPTLAEFYNLNDPEKTIVENKESLTEEEKTKVSEEIEKS